ncbi:MAG TPA: polyprenol monophosphomannose synthase [Terriglobales bacterium]|nr:polyprenol monophosphomannose synthase [Terriglobales bacterium]
MRLSIVSPTYNEANNLEPLVKELTTVLTDSTYEVVIVDDDSPDLTWKKAEELGQRFPLVRSLRRTKTRGLSSAVIEGFNVAQGDMVACMDADLQHDPVILPSMIQALDQGADLAVGSRYVEGGGTGEWSWSRWISSWTATKLAHILLHVELKDPMSGFFLMRRTDFLRVRDRLDAKGFKILLEIVARLQPERIVEVPYTFRNRRIGKSKLSSTVILQYLQQLWKLSRHAPPARKNPQNGGPPA